MHNVYQRQPFPIWAVPNALQNSLREAYTHSQAPIELIFSTAMTAISIASQDQIRVKFLPNHEILASLFFKIIADSGERKSFLFQLLLQSIFDFDASFHEKREAARKAFESSIEIWQLEHATLVAAFEKAIKKGQPTDAAKLALEKHNQAKPVLEKFPKLIYADATPEAIAYGLYSQWPSAALISDEAGMILNGRAGQDLPLLNKLRDGDSLSVDRKSTESFTLTGATFSMLLMVQPKTFRHFLEHQGRDARDIGFLARCLIAWPDSTQGTRFVYINQVLEWKYLPIFHDRITAILQEGYSNGVKRPPVTLELSVQARGRLMDFQNFIESELGHGRCFSDVKDAASKMPETAVRMSALFHHFEGRTGEIQEDTFQQAIEICTWYLYEFKYIFGAKPEIPLEQADAQQLQEWLWQIFVQSNGINLNYSKNFIRQHCPNSLRNKNRLNRALLELIYSGKISAFMHGKTNMISLNPQWFYFQVPMQPYRW
ncbi:MAG: YfjI family protein [Rhodoferax sp.]|uniref:YfjI family protein n=1 Tax=Rhodoferax sp. TaxID=50421 RepID=UPI00261A4784|nr:YfjI family protein [Rhodoferax sp.]MDD2882843.1 YfjI family protein [Rhodoferax sp.]